MKTKWPVVLCCQADTSCSFASPFGRGKMKSTIVVLFVVLVLLVVAQIISSDSVIDLTEYSLEEFKSELENHESIFVKFFVPSCPHCKSISADYVATAAKLNSEDLMVPLAEVDCSREPEGSRICKKYNIEGYPTLKLFRSGNLFKEYSGKRDTKSMVNWLKVYAIDRSTKLTSLIQLKSLLEKTKGDTMVIGFFRSHQEKGFDKWTKSLKKVADCKSCSHIKFWTLFYDHSTIDSRILLASLPWKLKSIASNATSSHLAVPFVAMYRDGRFINSDLESIIYIFKKQMFNTHELHEWIFKNVHGLIAIRTPELDATALRPSKVGNALSLCYPFDFANEPQSSHKWRDQLLPLAIIHWDIFFAICHIDLYKSEKCSTQKFKYSCHQNQITGKSTWPLVFMTDSIGIEYRMEVTFQSEKEEEEEAKLANFSFQLDQFIKKFKSGDIEANLPTGKSVKHSVLSLHKKFPLVLEVTNKNIETAVAREEKPIVLSIYNSSNSTDSLMQELFTNLTQVANHFKKLNYSPVMIVAAMDSETNYVPSELQLKWYSPPIYFAIIERPEKRKWKKIIRFKGQPKKIIGTDSLVSFVLDAVNGKKFDVNGKATLQNLHHKSTSVGEKSEL